MKKWLKELPGDAFAMVVGSVAAYMLTMMF